NQRRTSAGSLNMNSLFSSRLVPTITGTCACASVRPRASSGSPAGRTTPSRSTIGMSISSPDGPRGDAPPTATPPPPPSPVPVSPRRGVPAPRRARGARAPPPPPPGGGAPAGPGAAPPPPGGRGGGDPPPAALDDPAMEEAARRRREQQREDVGASRRFAEHR